MIEGENKKTISKIKKVIDSHFFTANGEKSILIWNTFIGFNLNEWAWLGFLLHNLFLLNKYMGCNLFSGISSKLIKKEYNIERPLAQFW